MTKNLQSRMHHILVEGKREENERKEKKKAELSPRKRITELNNFGYIAY